MEKVVAESNRKQEIESYMSYKPPIGDPEVLKRRVVANPKYEKVESTVDTGMNANLAKLIRETEPVVKQQRDELFHRVRASTVAAALEAKHLEMKMREYEAQGMEVEGGSRDAAYGGLRPPPAPPSLPQSILDEYQIPKAPKKEYLILDVRDREDYERCHILGALHFPPAKLSHATNPYSPEILAFKNKENRVIVLYDLEEEVVVGRKVGNIFFEKGCDNVVIIAGGLREFVQQHSHLILGECPVPIIPRNPRLSSRGSVGTPSVVEGASRMHGGSAATSCKPKSLSSSLAKPQSSSSWK